MEIPFDSAADLSMSGLHSGRTAARRQSPSRAALTGVLLVTSDPGITREITAHLSEQSIESRLFPHLPALKSFHEKFEASCIIVDVDSHSVSRSDLDQVLSEKETPPTIVIGSALDAKAAVHTMKTGAYDFFTKPTDLSLLLASVSSALSADRRAKQRRMEIQMLRDRHRLLTGREREVLPLVVGGLLNKQAASVLGISEITLQIHRGQVMRKMQADSLADLVRIAMRLKLPYWGSSKLHESKVPLPSAASTPGVTIVSRQARSAHTRGYAGDSA